MTIKERVFKELELEDVKDVDDLYKLTLFTSLIVPCIYYLGIEFDHTTNDSKNIKFSIPEKYAEPMNVYSLDGEDSKDLDHLELKVKPCKKIWNYIYKRRSN